MSGNALSTAQVLVRVLLALAVILNGTAIPGDASAADASDAGMHSEHQGHGDMAGETPADAPAHSSFTDCCAGGSCGCGCAAPAAAPDICFNPGCSEHPAVDVVFVDSLHESGLLNTPFRPPA